MITLQKVTQANLQEIIHLSVHENQRHFVASNTQSILEAYVTITSGHVALPFGLYEGDTLVGFVMFGYDNYDNGDPDIIKDNYCIWRFMIDKNHQGRGLGKQALQACLDYVCTYPCGKADYCWLSYEPENTVAKALYTAAGFCETGEVCDGEIISALKL